MDDQNQENPTASSYKDRPGPPSTHSHALTRAKQVAFLTALSIHGTITKAAIEADIDRGTHYDWLEKDEEYAKAFRDAEGIFADGIREEVYRRGKAGYEEPIVYQGVISRDDAGRPVTVTRFSDRMLELLAKAKCPEFRDKTELSGEGGGPIKIMAVRYPVKAKSVEEWMEQHKPKQLSDGAEEPEA